MMIHRYLRAVLATATLVLTTASTTAAAGEDKLPHFETFRKAQIVMTAKLTEVVAGPVGASMPPMYTHRLHLKPEKVLRGDVAPDKPIVAHNVARQMKEPVFPVGKTCIVVLAKSRGSYRVGLIEEATDKLMESARRAATFPIGWKMADGKPVSPWAALGAKAWPKELTPPAAAVPITCSVTGRPAFQAGPHARFAVEKVPPVKAIKWTNPDGDGLYKITLTNSTDRPLTVPALLSDGKELLWDESLVIVCQGKARPVPTAKGVTGSVKPAVLEPGQSVSTVVNAFLLKNVEWPRGGYRIEFQFCLGEHSNVQSFYYMSRHHDKVRAKAVAENK